MKGRIVMDHIKLKEIIYITTAILCSIISMTGKEMSISLSTLLIVASICYSTDD